MTLVSVTVCSYNSAATLGPALDSALNQSFPQHNYEVLVVNDGSSDNTSDVIDEYAKRHPNIRPFNLKENRGLVAACNFGLDAAKGKYFIRLDADDLFHEDILSSLAEQMESDKTDMSYCDRYDITLENGHRELIQTEPFNLFNLLATGTMFRMDMVRALGGYRPLFWEEYDLYMRYLVHSGRSPVRVPNPLYYYSLHDSSMTADKASVSAGWKELREVWGVDALRRFGAPEIMEEG